MAILVFTAACLCGALAEGLSRDYSSAPALMTMQDGTPVTTPEEFAARRQELLALFADTMYGPIPTEGFETAFEVIEEGEALNGAAIRKQIKITVTTEKGACDALMLLVTPKTKAPVPVVFGLSFAPVHTVLADPQILASYSLKTYPTLEEAARGSAAEQWCVAEAVSRGYGVAVAFCEDFSQDHIRLYDKRLIALFDESNFKTLSAWAFGLQRMADYLVTDPGVDAQRLVVLGTSRLGKAALWAGANDERIALTIPNVAGTCGAAMSRRNEREDINAITITFRWWLNPALNSYAGKEDELPVDQHELLACLAPRKVYLSNAQTDTSNDVRGTWDALMLSAEAFRLYGMETIEGSTQDAPPAGPVFSESMGFHIREGNHGITPVDWGHYFDYMDQYLK